MSLDEFMEAVKERCGESDPFEAACWFIAVQEARAVFDAYSVKDLARTIVDGEAIAGPYKTQKDVEGWLENMFDEYDPILDLNAHFGVRTP